MCLAHTFVHEKPGSNSSEGDLFKMKDPERHILLLHVNHLIEPSVPPCGSLTVPTTLTGPLHCWLDFGTRSFLTWTLDFLLKGSLSDSSLLGTAAGNDPRTCKCETYVLRILQWFRIKNLDFPVQPPSSLSFLLPVSLVSPSATPPSSGSVTLSCSGFRHTAGPQWGPAGYLHLWSQGLLACRFLSPTPSPDCLS